MDTEAELEERLHHPFREDAGDPPDEILLNEARAGARDALELLFERHQPWVFNMALRMLYHHADAEDATQDVFVKVLKGLPSFRGDSKFRTWLYRIAVNHVLNIKKDRWSAADAVCSFEVAAGGLRQTPELDLPDPQTVPVPVEVLIEETKITCSLGTLLCLDGRQRLVFILGEVFGVSDEVGAEIVEGRYREPCLRRYRDSEGTGSAGLRPIRGVQLSRWTGKRTEPPTMRPLVIRIAPTLTVVSFSRG